ncbi:DUF2975 domain-containing protein [Schnuerera sp. xch1]|uniref:DUF2975 domain-containing protein n=1 Tax=Schnuerera sp. xch1 TaxID=2874283 RepID=UPI001CC04B5D|nr:DUF2975 domain-containing protein [Schnuerera sp. xch1]MBZ2175372.1 DUF2975 domain-containing protein [Schnuerera sp. xch1]
MKRETFFLKAIIIFIGISILALCIFWLPFGADYFGYLVLIGVYTTAISFFFALYQGLKLLSYIDKNKAFSELSVKALKYIKYCAITISAIYVGLVPFLYPIAEVDDAPGLIGFPIIFIFTSSVIATFTAVLQKLLKDAIDIKNDNDLTI